MIKTTFKILINNLYEGNLEISNIKEEKLARSLLNSQNQSKIIKTRDLINIPTGVITIPPITYPPTDQIVFFTFYQLINNQSIDKDFYVNDITENEIVKWQLQFVKNFDGNNHTFTFTFQPDQNIHLQLFKSTQDARISNVRFVFDMSNSVIQNSGIFGDVKSSMFYNVHITIKNNNGMEITYSKDNQIYGLFAKTVKSSSLVHIGIFMEDNLRILFKMDDSFDDDAYYGFITGSFVDDSVLVGAGGLFVQAYDIILNTTEFKNTEVYFGGLIGKSSIQLGDSLALYNNVEICQNIRFGGLIGKCIECQISTSFVEINDIAMKTYEIGAGGLVSKTLDTDSYSIIYYCYFKLKGVYKIDGYWDEHFGGIVGEADTCIMNTVVVEIAYNSFSLSRGLYFVAVINNFVNVTNSLAIGLTGLVAYTNIEPYFHEVYTIGFLSDDIPKLDKSDNVSHYLNNITYPFMGIEGFTERSEILLTKNSDDKYRLSYLDNTRDFYYSIPAGLSSPFDISTITESTCNFTLKILPKRTTKSILIYTNDNQLIYSKNDIFDVSTSRNAIITFPTAIASPEEYVIIHTHTFVLYTVIKYDQSKIGNSFIGKTINGGNIESSIPKLVNILKNNMMRVRINCTNNIVKYTGPAIFEGFEPFQFTFTNNIGLGEEIDTIESCSFKFIGTSLDLFDIVIKFHAISQGISISQSYPNLRTKQEIDLTVSITTTPSSTVSFLFKCPDGLTCSRTSFDINNPSEFKVIHISQKNPTNNNVSIDLSFDITSTDLLYQGLSPYTYSFLLNNVEPEYLIEPMSFNFKSFKPVESSYKILTTTIPTANIKITVSSNCSYYYYISPTSFTLSSINDFVGIFNITPNTSSLTSNFNCIISNNIETLASEYVILNSTLNVSINTKFVDLTPAPKLLYVNESEEEYSIVLHFDRNCYADEGIIKLYENDTNCDGKFISTNPSVSYHICLWMDRKTLKIYYEDADDLPSSITVQLEEYLLRSTDTSSEYSTGSSVVTLRAANPEMTYAGFDDGYTITIEFDNDIGYGITDGELCSNIFISTKSLGCSTCSFGKDKKTVIIDLSADAEIMPGNTIEPLPNRIKGSINSMFYAQESRSLNPPAHLPPVKAIVDYPTAITSCQTLIIDGSYSSGGGSRSLKYRWKNMTVVNENVTKYLKSDSAILTIPAGILKENITLKLTITNFFGNSNSMDINIKVKDLPILQSSIEGSPTLTLKTDKEMYVKGHGNLVECGESVEVCNILSKFSLFIVDDNDNNNNEIETKNFTTKDPTRLYFAPHSLPIGKYKIKYTITMEGLSNSVSEVLLNVVLGDFYFNVKGYPVMSLPNTDKLTLTVEAKDLDIPDTEFEYKWNCSSDKGDNNFNELIKDMNESTITFDENTFTPGVYNFTAIANPKETPTRTMSVYILVTFTDGKMKLSFSIESVFNNSTVYKPSDVIGLRATFDNNNGNNNNNNLRYLWVYLSDNSLNPLLSRNDSSLVYISCERMNTSLLIHTIRFYIYEGNTSLYGDYVFIVVQPPKGGYIDSSSHEISLGDSIVISSSNWEGAKEFTYRFGVLVNGNLNYLQPIYGNSNKYNGILPLGNKQKDYILTLIVFVKDKYGAISNTTNGKDGKPLIIKCYPISSIENIKGITKKLEAEKNYDQIFNFANGIKNQITTDLANTTNCVNGNKSSNNSCNCFEGYTGILCDLHIPIDGGLSVNYTYSKPDRICGNITYYRWKACDNPKPKYGGKECEIIKEKITEEIEPCEDSDKNVDGGWGNWNDWSECNVKCIVFNGNEVEGVKIRNRLCNNPPPYNEGKDCEGNSTESVKCFKSCVAPNKLCPGEYINNDGKAVGSKCNDRGKCVINREGCKEYEPNCHSTCECYEGYSGSSCQYTDEEFETNKEIKSSLITSINTAIENILITPESVEQQSSTILNVIDPPIDLDEDALRLIYTIIDNTIAKLKDDKPIEIFYKSISDYIKATSLLIQNEWTITAKESNKRNLQNNNEVEYSIGSKLIDLYKNISVIHYNQQYSAPLHISTGSLGISLIKADLSFDPNATISTNQAEVDLGNIIDVNTTTEISIFDFIDNPNKNDYIRTKRTSGLTSITLSNKNGDVDVSVRDFKKPIYYRQRLNDDTELRHIRCSFYNGEDLKYTGVVLVGIIKVENGSNYALCAMLHLTDFTVQKKSIFPKMNFVNPIGDSKLLGNYDSSNMLVPIILGSVLILCIVFWIYTKCKDKNEDKIVSDEKARNFLLYGKLRPSKKEEEKKEEDDSMKRHFFKYYAERLLDEHKILAPAFQSMNELMEITRSQNVLCLTAIILTDTAVNALFFGSNPANIAQVVTTSIISTLVMLPVTLIIPFFFKFANTYKSHTLQSKSKNKKSKLTVLRNKIELIKNKIMSQNSTLLKYQSFMLIESGIFIILELIFTIIALIILPSGYITIVVVGILILYILETFLVFVVTTLKQPFYFMYMFVVDFLFMLFNVAFLVFYFIILGRNDTVLYNTWKFLYDISSTQEVYCLYIEESLNCCGWNNINDYNVSDCTTINVYVSGNQNSCKDIYYDKFDQYSPLWIIYFLIGVIAFIPKLVVLVKYVLYQFNQFEKVMAEDRINTELNIEKEKKEEQNKRKSAGEMIVRSCRKLLFKRHFLREREYIIWLRNRKIRAALLSFANFIVCLYILIMIYINLLYGVKFESSQANTWIISSVLSMVIDVILQQPSMILLKSVAFTTLTSLI